MRNPHVSTVWAFRLLITYLTGTAACHLRFLLRFRIRREKSNDKPFSVSTPMKHRVLRVLVVGLSVAQASNCRVARQFFAERCAPKDMANTWTRCGFEVNGRCILAQDLAIEELHQGDDISLSFCLLGPEKGSHATAPSATCIKRSSSSLIS